MDCDSSLSLDRTEKGVEKDGCPLSLLHVRARITELTVPLKINSDVPIHR